MKMVKKFAADFCVIFTIITVVPAVIGQILEGNAGLIMSELNIFRTLFSCALLSAMKLCAGELEKGAMRRWPFVARKLILYPFFLGVTLWFVAPLLELAPVMSVWSIVLLFSVTYVIAGAIALLVQSAKKKRYTQAVMDYLGDGEKGGEEE